MKDNNPGLLSKMYGYEVKHDGMGGGTPYEMLTVPEFSKQNILKKLGNPDNATIEDIENAGVFTSVLVVNNIPVLYDEHIIRLIQNFSALYKSDYTNAVRDFSEFINNVLEKNKTSLADTGITAKYGLRLTLWNMGDRVDIGIYPFLIEDDNLNYPDGIKVVAVPYNRDTPEIKKVYGRHTDKIQHMMAQSDAQEALLTINTNGASNHEFEDLKNYLVTEGLRSNVFIYKDDTLYTPATGMLPGVSRKKVIDLADEVGIKVSKQDITLADLVSADAAFVTGSTKNIRKIAQVATDGLTVDIGIGKNQTVIDDLIRKYNEKYLVN